MRHDSTSAFSDITARHVQGKKLEKTVWNLLNVYTFVKWHVKVRKVENLPKIVKRFIKLLNETEQQRLRAKKNENAA